MSEMFWVMLAILSNVVLLGVLVRAQLRQKDQMRDMASAMRSMGNEMTYTKNRVGDLRTFILNRNLQERRALYNPDTGTYSPLEPRG